jgi:hypothetical protein
MGKKVGHAASIRPTPELTRGISTVRAVDFAIIRQSFHSIV